MLGRKNIVMRFRYYTNLILCITHAPRIARWLLYCRIYGNKKCIRICVWGLVYNESLLYMSKGGFWASRKQRRKSPTNKMKYRRMKWRLYFTFIWIHACRWWGAGSWRYWECNVNEECHCLLFALLANATETKCLVIPLSARASTSARGFDEVVFHFHSHPTEPWFLHKHLLPTRTEKPPV